MRFLLFLVVLMFLGEGSLAAQPTADNKVVTGMVLINDQTPVDFNAILAAAKKDWGIRVDSSQLQEKTLILHTPWATIMLANMDYPASPVEIKSAAEGAWMWSTARDEATAHQSQVVISVIGSATRSLKLYQLFTRSAAAVLENSRSCGVYMPTQYVLQSRTFFLQAARNLDQNVPAVYCWVYFGLFLDGGKTCAYTYGLTEFGMTDLEIVKSDHTMQEAHAVLYDVVKDALEKGITLKDGSEIETLEGEKFTLMRSKSPYMDAETLKVSY